MAGMDDWGECAWTARDLLDSRVATRWPDLVTGPRQPASGRPAPGFDRARRAPEIDRLVAGDITEDLVDLLKERVRREGEEVLLRLVEEPRSRRRGRRAVAVKSFLAGAAACLFLLVGSGYPVDDRPVLVDETQPAAALLQGAPVARPDGYPPP